MTVKKICLGVHVHAEPKRLQETLASLRANTALSFDLLLLPDDRLEDLAGYAIAAGLSQGTIKVSFL